MEKWSIPCDVWLSKSGTPDNPSPRMAFAAGWNAAQAQVTNAQQLAEIAAIELECTRCANSNDMLGVHKVLNRLRQLSAV